MSTPSDKILAKQLELFLENDWLRHRINNIIIALDNYVTHPVARTRQAIKNLKAKTLYEVYGKHVKPGFDYDTATIEEYLASHPMEEYAVATPTSDELEVANAVADLIDRNENNLAHSLETHFGKTFEQLLQDPLIQPIIERTQRIVHFLNEQLIEIKKIVGGRKNVVEKQKKVEELLNNFKDPVEMEKLKKMLYSDPTAEEEARAEADYDLKPSLDRR